MDLLFSFDISVTAWILGGCGALTVGISKSGVKGISLIIVTLMALAFGAKASSGLIVPLLVIGDIFAVVYYNRHTRWQYIIGFLPWMILGLIIGAAIGKDLDAQAFKNGMAFIILSSTVMMYWWDRKKSKNVPSHWAFAGLIGTMAGITTMIGNLAGAFSNIFFLAMRLPKNEFIGTAAWLFLIINLLKLPFHIWWWGTITENTLQINLWLIPAVLLGLLLGIQLVKSIKDNLYRKIILVLTAVGALLIIVR